MAMYAIQDERCNRLPREGRSESGDSFWCLLGTRLHPSRVATVATLPSALFEERMVSLGASWVFAFQPLLPLDDPPRFRLQDESWARRLTQSPELDSGQPH